VFEQQNLTRYDNAAKLKRARGCKGNIREKSWGTERNDRSSKFLFILYVVWVQGIKYKKKNKEQGWQGEEASRTYTSRHCQ